MGHTMAALLILCLAMAIGTTFCADDTIEAPAAVGVKEVKEKQEVMKTSADLDSANSYGYYGLDGLGYSPYAYGYGYAIHPRFGYINPYPYYHTYHNSYWGVPYTFHTFI